MCQPASSLLYIRLKLVAWERRKKRLAKSVLLCEDVELEKQGP